MACSFSLSAFPSISGSGLLLSRPSKGSIYSNFLLTQNLYFLPHTQFFWKLEIPNINQFCQAIINQCCKWGCFKSVNFSFLSSELFSSTSHNESYLYSYMYPCKFICMWNHLYINFDQHLLYESNPFSILFSMVSFSNACLQLTKLHNQIRILPQTKTFLYTLSSVLDKVMTVA